MLSLLSWLRRIYSLDTLDTRFTSSATTPANAADTRPPSANDARANAIAQKAPAPLWRTPEFFIYYLFFITLVPLMFKTVIDASKGECGPLETPLKDEPWDADRGSSNLRKPPNLPYIFPPSVTRVDSWSPSRE